MENMICHPLKGLCVLLNVIETHLYRRQFISSKIDTDLLPENTPIKFVEAVQDIKSTDAHPIVAYSIEGVSVSRSRMGGMNSGVNMSDMNSNLNLKVSTVNSLLTFELAFELAMLCSALTQELITEEHLSIVSCNVGKVVKDPNSNYYIANTVIQLHNGYPIWKNEHLDSILREVRINVEPLFEQELT